MHNKKYNKKTREFSAKKRVALRPTGEIVRRERAGREFVREIRPGTAVTVILPTKSAIDNTRKAVEHLRMVEHIPVYSHPDQSNLTIKIGRLPD